jgi:curved DNA-binding protein CbpA
VVDHYKTLGIDRKATASQIKSAYRKLARKRHPDVNGGSEDAAREFALLALAYRTLSDPEERAYYDAQCERLKDGASVLSSDNPHAQRMRRAVSAQIRFDRTVDFLMESDRRETFARAQAVFTTVTLFLSTFIVAMLKPRFWQNFHGVLGRAVLVTLFLIGVWHLFSRLRKYLEQYTYRPKTLQDSIMTEEVKPEQPYTRFTAYSFLLVGYLASIAAGLFAGAHVYYIVEDLAFFFDQHVSPDLFFYPPIAVLIVDTVHSVAARIDS